MNKKWFLSHVLSAMQMNSVDEAEALCASPFRCPAQELRNQNKEQAGDGRSAVFLNIYRIYNIPATTNASVSNDSGGHYFLVLGELAFSNVSVCNCTCCCSRPKVQFIKTLRDDFTAGELALDAVDGGDNVVRQISSSILTKGHGGDDKHARPLHGNVTQPHDFPSAERSRRVMQQHWSAWKTLRNSFLWHPLIFRISH